MQSGDFPNGAMRGSDLVVLPAALSSNMFFDTSALPVLFCGNAREGSARHSNRNASSGDEPCYRAEVITFSIRYTYPYFRAICAN